MDKIRVLFPFMESGYGHIMPLRSIEQTFRKKYGDRVEVVSSQFYTESGDPHLIRFEKMMGRQVKMYNTIPALGHFATAADAFFGARLSTLGAMRLSAPYAHGHGIAHMAELKPDVVVSTHWASNYYAQKQKKNKPFTIMYCPDAQLNNLFEYPCDLLLMSMPYGYEKALRKKQYSIQNCKMVPFWIRNEAFEVDTDKAALRKKLGIPENNFTILLAEGGYGIGKMAKITEQLVSLHLPLTVMPICGTNQKLFEHFKTLKCAPEVAFRPYAFADHIFDLEAASDIFCGKSGNMIAELTFFGCPSIVTHCANHIEENIADHYINTVGCAVKETNVKKIIQMILSCAEDRTKLEPFRKAALDYHDHFGSDKGADVIWEAICQRFPELAQH